MASGIVCGPGKATGIAVSAADLAMGVDISRVAAGGTYDRSALLAAGSWPTSFAISIHTADSSRRRDSGAGIFSRLESMEA
jgi:hypothetical protein